MEQRQTRTVNLGRLIEPEVTKSAEELDELQDHFVVHYSEPIRSKLMAHAIRSKHTEVFGLLLGSAIQTATGKWRTVIKDFMPAEQLQQSTPTFVEV